MSKQVWPRLSTYAFVRLKRLSRFLSPYVFVYFRGAQKPNAGLGHAQASLGATLGLRICAILKSLAFQMLVFSQCHHGHRTGGALQRVT